MSPAQVWKASEPPIRRDPLVAGLYRQGGQISIGDRITGCGGSATELIENIPMVRAGSNDPASGMRVNLFDEGKSYIEQGGGTEYPGMRDDARKHRSIPVPRRQRFGRCLRCPPASRDNDHGLAYPDDGHRPNHLRQAGSSVPSMMASRAAESFKFPGRGPPWP